MARLPTPLAKVASSANFFGLPRVKQTLVAPPFVPAHEQVALGGLRIVEVEMAIEGEITQADDGGAEIWVMAFDGSVQGPFIAEHECDYIELILTTLKSSAMGHNINVHASTVAMGGGFRLSLRAGRGDRPNRQRPS